MKYWKKEDSDAAHIKTLKWVIGLLIAIVIMLVFGWHLASRDITVHIPPDISSGVTMKADEIPAASIYSFAFYVWQVIGNWPANGQVDYPQNIQAYSPYITPTFKNELLQQVAELNAKGQLVDRVRTVQGQIGEAYRSSNVKALGKGAWEVDIVVRVTERMGNAILQDVLIEYPLRVIRYDVNRENNQWGLAIDGFVSEPRRIKNYI